MANGLVFMRRGEFAVRPADGPQIRKLTLKVQGLPSFVKDKRALAGKRVFRKGRVVWSKRVQEPTPAMTLDDNALRPLAIRASMGQEQSMPNGPRT